MKEKIYFPSCPPRLARRAQGGAALAIALILLVVMTMLGLSSVKTITQQEQMTAHSYDRSLAYQFAEAALREGEGQARIQALALNPAGGGFPRNQYISDNVCAPGALNDCTNGLCSTPDPDCAPRWLDANFSNNNWVRFNGLPQIINANGNVLSTPPEYIIELLRPVGTAVCTTPIASANFDRDCNQKFPDPDDTLRQCIDTPTCVALNSNPTQQSLSCQPCNYYRYRITARVQPAGRAAVMVQSIYSVQPQ